MYTFQKFPNLKKLAPVCTLSEFRYQIFITMSWFQSTFRLQFLFWLLIGISIPIAEIEIPITFDHFDQ
jgi:hypothetical protein